MKIVNKRSAASEVARNFIAVKITNIAAQRPCLNVSPQQSILCNIQNARKTIFLAEIFNFCFLFTFSNEKNYRKNTTKLFFSLLSLMQQ
jgi:hypothetical protein